MTTIHGDPFSFPCFGNVGPLLTNTLNIPRFSVGILVWLFFTLVVPNSLDSSQENTLCQVHQININPFHSSPIKPSPFPPFSYDKTTTTSIWEPRKKKRNTQEKKKNQGGKPLAPAS